MYDIYPVGGHVLTQIVFPPPREDAGSAEDGCREKQNNESRLRARLVELACLDGSRRRRGVEIDNQIKDLERELEELLSCEPSICSFAEASGILQLAGPCGLATDGEGRLIVLDWARERLQLLCPDGAPPLASCALASSGVGGGYTDEDLRRAAKMMEPCAVAVDDEGKVAAINSDLKAVVVYLLN